jgi:hypothetical protein
MAVDTGKNRTFGQTTMAHMSELRRQAVVIASEINEEIPADNDFPRRVSVVRRYQTAAGDPARGIEGAWAAVAGLTDLVGRVRTSGEWRDKATGTRTLLGEGERTVLLTDIPAGGDGEENEVLTTDRVSFSDPLRGSTVWEVVEVRVNKRDGIVVCKVRYARED